MLTLMTVATHSARHMPLFLESSARAGLEPVILGNGKRWTGFGMRLSLLRSTLRAMRGRRRVVLFSDAHDSIVLDPAEVILKRFEKMNHPLVFSAEKNCWPDAWKAFMYPPASTPWRFLNAGGFIGEAGAIRERLEQLGSRVPAGLDDQRWWTNQLLEEPERIRLDTRCEIFQTLWASMGDLEIRRRIHNRVTGTRPSIVHGNGWTDMSPFLEWYRRKNG